MVGKDKRSCQDHPEVRLAKYKGVVTKGCIHRKDVGSALSKRKGQAIWLAQRGMHICLTKRDSSLSYTGQGSLREQESARGCLKGKQAFSIINGLLGEEKMMLAGTYRTSVGVGAAQGHEWADSL